MEHPKGAETKQESDEMKDPLECGRGVGGKKWTLRDGSLPGHTECQCWEALGMGCLEGMSPVSDIATSLVMIQACWRDVVAIVARGLQQIPLQGVG